jgi:hypothetical protein
VEPDTVVLNSLASFIMAADASDMKEISEAFEEMSSHATKTTLTTVHATTTGPGITSTKTGEHTASSTESTTTTTSNLRCYHQCPTREECNCYCKGHAGEFQTMSSTSGITNYQPCTWTTLPPLATKANVGPITSTQSNGDVVYCISAHRAETTGNRAKCVGTISTISTHSTATSTRPPLVATGTGKPLGELYIGIIFQNGGSIDQASWNVYIPKVGTTPNWCKDPVRSIQEKSGDITRFWYSRHSTSRILVGLLRKWITSIRETTRRLDRMIVGRVRLRVLVILRVAMIPQSVRLFHMQGELTLGFIVSGMRLKAWEIHS